MEFRIRTTSDEKVKLDTFNVKTLGVNGFGQFIQKVEINSLEEFLKLFDEIKIDMILYKRDGEYFIELYDTYRE